MLQLIIQAVGAVAIPLALFFAAQLFTIQQNQTSLQIAKDNRTRDLQIAATRYANDQRLAEDQQRETTLKTYLDDISNLLLNQNQNLRNSQPGSEVRKVARERTLTAFRRLDAERNQIITQFLQDAELLQGENAPINFSYADLHGANLNGAWLNYADLSGAWLSYTHLRGAWLQGTHLSKASLIETDLSGTHLEGADLSGADLSGANLDGATGITSAELEQQAKSLKGATMPDGSKHP